MTRTCTSPRCSAFAKALLASDKPGVARLIEEQRARQTRGNEVLAAALERIETRGLHERLLALADAAEGVVAEA